MKSWKIYYYGFIKVNINNVLVSWLVSFRTFAKHIPPHIKFYKNVVYQNTCYWQSTSSEIDFILQRKQTILYMWFFLACQFTFDHGAFDPLKIVSSI